MKRRVLTIAAVVAGGVIVWFAQSAREEPVVHPMESASLAPAPASSAVHASTERTSIPDTRTLMPSAEAAAGLYDPTESAHEDLAILDLLISDYRRCFSENPVGENEEITACLTGRNPKGLVFLRSEYARLDGDGRLLDRWGTPYRFHALAGDRMEIHSAGPDREPHTVDDVTLGE